METNVNTYDFSSVSCFKNGESNKGNVEVSKIANFKEISTETFPMALLLNEFDKQYNSKTTQHLIPSGEVEAPDFFKHACNTSNEESVSVADTVSAISEAEAVVAKRLKHAHSTKRACVEQAFSLVENFIEEMKSGFRNESLLVEIKKDEGIVKYQLTKLLHQMQQANVFMKNDAQLKHIGEVALPCGFFLPEFVNLYSYRTNQDQLLNPDYDSVGTEPFVFDEMIDANGVVSVHALHPSGEVVVELISSKQREERDPIFMDAVSAEFMSQLEAKELEYGLAPTVPKADVNAEAKAETKPEAKPVVKKSKVSPIMAEAFEKANARKSHKPK